MKTIQAVYENGVFRPTERVDLPDHSKVEFEPRVVEPPSAGPGADNPTMAEQIAALRETDPGLAAVYEVLSRRFHSGHHDTAERHNEHQP